MTPRSRWQLAVVMLIAAPRVAAVAGTTPTIMPDSERYRDDATPFVPFQVWDGYGPGVLTQLVHLLPLSVAIVVQTVLVTALWGFAALYAASLATDRLSWPTFLLIQGWSLSPWFVIWDAWVLTEALNLAGCALAAVGVGAARSGARHGHWVAVAGLGVAVTARPFIGAMLLPLVALVLLWPLSAARLRALAGPLVASALLTLFATWQVLTVAQTASAPFSYLREPESLTHVQASDRFAGRAHLPGYLELARDAGMPSCPQAEALAAKQDTDILKLAALRAITDCPELDDWLASGGLPWTREFTHNTGATLGELVRPSYWLEDSFAGYMPFDERVRNLREFTRTRWDEVVLATNATMLAATAAATIAVLLLRRGQRAFILTGVAVVVAVSVYVWGVDGIEYWRHLLPAFAVLPLLAVTLLAGTTASVRAPKV